MSIKLTVTDLTDEGEAIAFTAEGLKVFIKGALPGEVVETDLYGITPNYAQGKLLKVLEANPCRCPPFCDNSCGSCAFTELAYNAEIELKKQKLHSLFKTKLPESYDETLFKDFVSMDNPFSYRNKSIYAVTRTDGKYVVGLYERDSHNIVRIRNCRLEQEWINRTRNRIIEVLNSEEFRKYAPDNVNVSNNVNSDSEVFSNSRKDSQSDIKSSSGSGDNLRYIFFRGMNDGEKMVVMVFHHTPENKQQLHLIAQAIKETGVDNILININDTPGNRVLSDLNQVYNGRDRIEINLLGLNFLVHPNSFLQINLEQTAKLYTMAVDMLELNNNDEVLDLYCGIGTISLYMAQKAKKVYGIEYVQSAVDNAKSNAEKNNIQNVDFRAGLVEKILPQIIAEGHRITKAVLDPARKGCDDSVFKVLADAGVDIIAYISCNPKSQCRDVAVAESYGYRMKSLNAVDLFPHTQHVETVVLLSREKQNG